MYVTVRAEYKVTDTQKHIADLLYECVLIGDGLTLLLVFKVRCTNYSELFMQHTVAFVYYALVVSFFFIFFICVFILFVYF